ncbi:MAG: 4-hydroxybenzoate octaprenyltransferase [Pseudomonadota bacterium]
MSEDSKSTQPETSSEMPEQKATPDSALPNWLTSLPGNARPYVALARIDRPVGIWLLYLPCLMGLFLMRIETGPQWIDLLWAILFLIGAVAMRGAGCTWNDITDRKIDAEVARTASRPIPSGAVTLQNAYLFLGAQLLVGFLIWLCLPRSAKWIAVFAIPLVVAYPFMKRVTWWPQAWLGFTFNWGLLVGAAVTSTSNGSHTAWGEISDHTGGITGATVVFYLGLVLWTVAYDTIYALQDKEDDALIGVKSTARLFDEKVLTATFIFQLGATMLLFLGAWFADAGRIGAVLALVFLGHSIWQMVRLAADREGRALGVFKSNVWLGVVLVGLLLVATLI